MRTGSQWSYGLRVTRNMISWFITALSSRWILTSMCLRRDSSVFAMVLLARSLLKKTVFPCRRHEKASMPVAGSSCRVLSIPIPMLLWACFVVWRMTFPLWNGLTNIFFPRSRALSTLNRYILHHFCLVQRWSCLGRPLFVMDTFLKIKWQKRFTKSECEAYSHREWSIFQRRVSRIRIRI